MIVPEAALARLAEVHFHHLPRLVVDADFQAFAEITGLVRRHRSSLLRWLDGVGYSRMESSFGEATRLCSLFAAGPIWTGRGIWVEK